MKVFTLDNTRRNRRFEYICSMSQNSLKKALIKELRDRKRDVESGDGYIYSPGSLPIMLTAHMDTVHKEVPKTIVYKEGKISSPEGIGGDDRCGIYMIMRIIKKLDCHVIFFEDEEMGGIGSEKFTKTETCKNLEGKLNYIIELDRMNSNDAVFYNLDNYDFEEFITESFWKLAYGSFSDISNICPAIGVAGVNLSCGYYNPHHLDEYVVLSEMDTAIREVKKLIKRTTKSDKFEYVELKYDYFHKDYYSFPPIWGSTKTQSIPKEIEYYIIYKSENGESIDIYNAISDYEAIGMFLCDHSNLTYNDIYEVGFN